MATDHPSDSVPPEDDAGHGPHAGGHEPVPPAEPPLEVVPLGSPTSPEPEPLPADALDDDLIELPAPTDDDVIDLGDADLLSDAPSPSALYTGTSVLAESLPPAAPGEMVPLGSPPADPEDVLVDLPPVEPTSPASGWLDATEIADLAHAPAANDWVAGPGDEADIFTDLREDRRGSDVLHGLGDNGPPSHSHIFDAPPAGAGRFTDPTDPTDPTDLDAQPLSDPASGGLYTDFGPPGVPASDVFADPPSAAPVDAQGRNHSAAGPFTGAHGVDAESEINLAAPAGFGSAAGQDSSIFHTPPPAGPVEPNGDVTDLELFDDEPTGEANSDIFRTVPVSGGDPERVTFERPAGHTGRGDSQDSGQIDWTLPRDDFAVSQLLSEAEADRAGIPRDLGSNPDPDADAPSPLDETAGIVIGAPAAESPPERPGRKAAKSGTGREKSLPADDGPRGRGGAVGWLAGGAVGLLTGVGACAGAYFGGLVPAGDTKAPRPLAVAADPGSAAALAEAKLQAEDLSQKLEASVREAATAKQQAEKAGADGKTAADRLAAETRRAAAAEQKATEAGADRQKLTADLAAAQKAQADADKAVADAKSAADAAVAKSQAEAKAVSDELNQKLTGSQTAAEAQTKRADTAAAQADAATAKLKTADEALARVIGDLKANKLVGDGDDVAAALAKLPDVLKQAAAALASADAKKAADSLLAAQAERNAARGEVIAANIRAATVATDAKKAAAEAEKKLAEAKAETAEKVKAAVDTSKAEAGAAIAQLTQRADRLAADLKAAEADTKRRLAEKDEEAARQLADARAGRAVALTSAEVRAKDRAAEGFAAGVRAYGIGRYADAEAVLDESAKQDGTDARVWYFLGLARYAQGKPADAAFKKGGELEGRGRPNSREIGIALEGVAGPARRALDAYRP